MADGKRFQLGPYGSLAEPCVVCGHSPVARVLWGMPAGPPDGEEEGYVTLGGCCLPAEVPSHRCARCGTDYWEDGRVRPAGSDHVSVDVDGERPHLIDPYGGPGGVTANLLFEHRPGWPDTTDREIAYGPTAEEPDTLWFVPSAAAEVLVAVAQVLWTATTWGELRDRLRVLEAGTYDAVMGWFDDLAPEDAAPFSAEQFPGVADGDFPPHVGLLVVEWAPAAVIERWGVRVNTVFNGTFTGFDAAAEADVVAALTAAGFDCRRDEAIIGSLLSGNAA